MSPEQEQAAKWIVPIAITLAATFGGAAVAEVTNEEPQIGPRLVQVPCDEVAAGDTGRSLCYRGVGLET